MEKRGAVRRMKARYPRKYIISKKAKQINQCIANSYVQNREYLVINQTLKLVAYVLNTEFGFGSERIRRVISGVGNTGDLREGDSVFWDHLEMVCFDQLKLDDVLSRADIDLDGDVVDVYDD